MSNKNKKVCTTLHYIEHFLTLIFAISLCISLPAFASLVDTSKGIMNSTIELASLAKTKLDCIKCSISRYLTDSHIGRDYFLLIDVLRKYDDMKEEINKLENSKVS